MSNSKRAKPRKRIYAELWSILKTSKVVATRLTLSTDTLRVAQLLKAARKGIQKEKYRDESFRVKYPNAKLESTFEGQHFVNGKSVLSNKLTITLDLGEVVSASDLFDSPNTNNATPLDSVTEKTGE